MHCVALISTTLGVLVLPAPVTARCLRVDLTDGAAPYMDIGLLVAGPLWRLKRGTAYGIREGWQVCADTAIISLSMTSQDHVEALRIVEYALFAT